MAEKYYFYYRKRQYINHMITIIVNKIMIFILVLCIVDVIREAFSFIGAWVRNTQMTVTDKRGWLLALSLAYIFTIIFTGLF